MTDEHENDEPLPPHYEGGIPILPGEAERAESARRAEKEDERKYKERQTSIQRGLLITQIALVVFGILGAAIGIYQAHTARESAEQAKRAADLASDSFETNDSNFNRTMSQMIAQTTAQYDQVGKLQESNSINREALESVQRAYVTFPPSPELHAINLPSGILFTLDMPIENAGNTMARGEKDRVSCVTPIGLLPNNYTFPDIDGGPETNCGTPWAATGANTIPAKGSMFSQTIVIDGKMLVEYMQQNPGPPRVGEPDHPTRNVFLYGWTTYRDIFKGTPEHLTEFCRTLTMLSRQGQNMQDSWGYCPMHNCTDEECPDYKKRIKESDSSPTWFNKDR